MTTTDWILITGFSAVIIAVTRSATFVVRALAKTAAASRGIRIE